LYDDVETGWKVALIRPMQANQVLKVLRFRKGLPVGWVTIGQVSDGKAIINTDDPALMDGKMVFSPHG